ncbi:MAG: phosphoribosylanthranilate isomerase [Dehalococcoidia bacterium]
MTRVKICGIKDKSHAMTAVEAGADFIGLVFAPSPRQISPAQAREIAGCVKKSSNTTKIVGVFVNAPTSQVNEVANFCALDWVQLSGDESWEYCHELKKAIIKVIHISSGKKADEILADIERGYELLPEKELVCLLDSRVEGAYGGTGQVFDWQLARGVSVRFPVMIAGGLTAANVGQLIRAVKPWGVDVSTGVESNGLKDASKIKAFVKAVRSTQ